MIRPNIFLYLCKLLIIDQIRLRRKYLTKIIINLVQPLLRLIRIKTILRPRRTRRKKVWLKLPLLKHKVLSIMWKSRTLLQCLLEVWKIIVQVSSIILDSTPINWAKADTMKISPQPEANRKCNSPEKGRDALVKILSVWNFIASVSLAVNTVVFIVTVLTVKTIVKMNRNELRPSQIF